MTGVLSEPPENHIGCKDVYYMHLRNRFVTEAEDKSVKYWSRKRNMCTSSMSGKAARGKLKMWTPCTMITPNELPVSISDEPIVYAADLPSEYELLGKSTWFGKRKTIVLALENRLVTLTNFVKKRKAKRAVASSQVQSLITRGASFNVIRSASFGLTRGASFNLTKATGPSFNIPRGTSFNLMSFNFFKSGSSP
jgi:hypothetical protein